MNLSKLIQLATDKDMTVTAYRVLMRLIAELQYSNEIPIHQGQIARELGILAPQVSKAMKLLVEKELIFEGPPLGQIKRYSLNRDLGFRTHPKHFYQLENQFRIPKAPANLKAIDAEQKEP